MTCVAIAAVFLTALAAAGQAPDVREASDPGDQRLQERLDERFDEASVERRLRQLEPRADIPPGRERNIVLGSRNPELILPIEAFSMYISQIADPSTSTDAMEEFNEFMKRAGQLDASDRFMARGANLVNSLAAQQELLRTLAGASESDRDSIRNTIRSLQAGECAERADLLSWCNKEFGPSFMDYLYDNVVPTMIVADEYEKADRMKQKEQLRRRSEGCK